MLIIELKYYWKYLNKKYQKNIGLESKITYN